MSPILPVVVKPVCSRLTAALGPPCPPSRARSVQNPSLDFILIFNPNSGPITDASDPSLYCVPRLRKLLPRSTFVGYVPTGYGERSAAAVKADIATYKQWNTIKVDKAGSTARLDGIFFDEAAWEPTSTNLVLSTLR